MFFLVRPKRGASEARTGSPRHTQTHPSSLEGGPGTATLPGRGQGAGVMGQPAPDLQTASLPWASH